MADDIEDQPVDELELGPKALAFVSALEVETLGELLALPEIRGPRRVITVVAPGASLPTRASSPRPGMGSAPPRRAAVASK